MVWSSGYKASTLYSVYLQALRTEIALVFVNLIIVFLEIAMMIAEIVAGARVDASPRLMIVTRSAGGLITPLIAGTVQLRAENILCNCCILELARVDLA